MLPEISNYLLIALLPVLPHTKLALSLAVESNKMSATCNAGPDVTRGVKRLGRGESLIGLLVVE